MLGLLPDWIWHFLLVVGVIGVFAGTLLQFIPFVRQYTLPIKIAGIVLALLSVFMEGSISKEAEYAAKIKELEDKVARAEQERDEANAKIRTKIVEKKIYIRQNVDRLVNQIVEVEKIINAECKVPKEAIDIINEAAKNRQPKDNK